MIYPPSKWKSSYIGGYYLGKCQLIRDVDNRFGIVSKANLSFIFETLDKISSIPWRINKRMLSTLEYLWANGGGVSKIPSKFFHDTQDIMMSPNSSVKDRKKLYQIIKINSETFSLQCSFLYKLQIAQAYKNVQKIYFPHNIDFRGRAYPMPPHLNHMGDDVSRGLLEYSTAKPLGKAGYKWLKISIANHMGKDKLSFENRIKYTESIWPTIEKIGKDPCNNLEWLAGDCPFQALSCIFDYYEATMSGSPETHMSREHCHVDGSFNGMQHYVAMCRDTNGAKSVNLIKADKPQDVYTSILDLVKIELKNEKDPKYADFAKKLLPVINRKTIKQTVMTSIYGVTIIGAREQISRQLKEQAGFTDQEVYKSSLYLAKVTFKCIGIRFTVILLPDCTKSQRLASSVCK